MEVRNLTEGSNLVDPLVDESFFPHSTNFSSLSISDTLKSRVLTSPFKLLEKGKAVLEGVMDHLEAYKTNVVRTENEKGRRERRPGLGISLPKFSMKPMLSQPIESLEPTYDLSISDPIEFFQDYAKKERAIKEMRLLKGLPLNDYDPDKPVPPRRQRRPGLGLLEGRHRPFSRFSMANDMFDNDITSTTQNEVQQDSNVISDTSSVKLSDSKSKTTSEAPELCDLLPLVDGLDDDGIQNLLLEKLNIKDVDVDEIVIPEWRVPFPNSVFKTNGVTKAARINNQASPGKLKSPLASISSLNRHIAKRTASRDLYSPLNIDQLPAEAIDTSTKPKRRADLAGQSCEDSSFLEVNEGDYIIDPREQEVMVIQVDQIGKTKNLLEPENLPIHGVGRIAVSGENSPLSPSGAVHATSELEAQEEEAAAQLPIRQIDFESIVMQNSSSYGVEGGMHEPSNMENIQVEEPAKEPRGSSKRTIEENGEPNMPSEADIFEETMEGGGTSELDVVLDPKETRSKRRKVEGGQRGQKKGDMKNRRFSLYDAGTKCENGVRRSTRVRMRPLQYWKGERFLYGRINESLATVIGVKYASPANDTKEPKLKVKSFVSDEHKDLLKYYDLY